MKSMLDAVALASVNRSIPSVRMVLLKEVLPKVVFIPIITAVNLVVVSTGKQK